MLAGFFILILAGICQGSFGIGYKKYPPFSWEVFWAVYSFMCLLTSLLFTWITAPNMWKIFAGVPLSSLAVPILCGMLWGISAIGFSKGITLIGMSMVYGISMGISTVTGSIVPMMMNHAMPHGKSAAVFIIGLILILAGVAIITKAGIIRDGEKRSSKLGIFLAMLSGLGSGAMNVGFSSTAATEIGQAFARNGYSDAAISSGKWLPVLACGCIVGMLFCMAESIRKRNIHTIIDKGAFKRSIILFAVSVIWFAALILYGLASNMLGNLGTTAGWILFNSLALIISSAWGLKTGEWDGKNDAKKCLFVGNATLIIAWLLIAMV